MDWDLLGSLYITPLLVEQKIEACCFGLVPPSVLSSLLPRFLELLTSLPVSSQVLGPWILIPVDPRNIPLSFPPTLSRFKCPWDPRHHQPLAMAPQLLSLGQPVGLVVNPEPDEVSHHTQTSATGGFLAPSSRRKQDIALFSSESFIPPGRIERGSNAGEN